MRPDRIYFACITTKHDLNKLLIYPSKTMFKRSFWADAVLDWKWDGGGGGGGYQKRGGTSISRDLKKME